MQGPRKINPCQALPLSPIPHAPDPKKLPLPMAAVAAVAGGGEGASSWMRRWWWQHRVTAATLPSSPRSTGHGSVTPIFTPRDGPDYVPYLLAWEADSRGRGTVRQGDPRPASQFTYLFTLSVANFKKSYGKPEWTGTVVVNHCFRKKCNLFGTVFEHATEFVCVFLFCLSVLVFFFLTQVA